MWYYAIGGESKGPVAEDEIRSLARQGVITDQTLVWREGMAEWGLYRDNRPPPIEGLATSASTEPQVVCARCGGRFPGGEVVQLGNGAYCATCKPLALQQLREGVPAVTGADEVRRQFLKHEASVKSIGYLYYLGAFALIVIGSAGLVGAGAAGLGANMISSIFLVLLGIGQFFVGTGLHKLKGWARIPTIILSGIGLIGFPIGTIINAYILYLVLSKKGKMVFSDEYRAVIEQTPHIKYRTSIVVWIFLALLFALIAFALIAAFLGRRA